MKTVKFSYVPRNSDYRNMMQALRLVVALENAIVLPVVVLFVSWSWKWAVVTGLTLFSLYALASLTFELNGKHEITNSELILRHGKRVYLRVPLGVIASARLARINRPPLKPSGMYIGYSESEKAYLVIMGKTNLIQIDLKEEKVLPLKGNKFCETSKIFITVDDPDEFLQALDSFCKEAVSKKEELQAGADYKVAPARPIEVTNGDAILVVKNLTKRFGHVKAVRDLSLKVKKGEVYGFLGENGAGKTTTLKMVTGLLPPDAGVVIIGGNEVWGNGLEAKRLLGYAPDVPLVYERLTAEEFLVFIARLHGLDRADAERKTEGWLETFQLREFKDELLSGFSLGMLRKISLAAALIHSPALVLMDEPLNGLDVRAARQVKDMIIQMRGQGKGVLLTTHTLAVAQELCDRIGIISCGSLVAEGTYEELREVAASGTANLEELFLALTANRGGGHES